MSAELRRRGWDVRVVASDLGLHSRAYSRRPSARHLRTIRQDVVGVPFVWLPAGSYANNDWRRLASMLIFSGAVFCHLIAVPRARNAVFVGSSPHLFGALSTWAAARLRGAAFVLEVRDLWPESYTAVTGDATSPQVRLMSAVASHLYRRSDAIIVLAEANADIVVEQGGDSSRLHFVPNGVDAGAFQAVRRGSDLRPSFRFVYTGAHGPANGLDVAVRAAASLAGTDSGVELVLVGDGASKRSLMSLAERLGADNVSFLDPVPKRDIPLLLSQYDAGLMVLADEELFSYGVSPNKLFDYMAAALPVLTNVPGLLSKIVDDAGAGRSCPPGDHQALATAMSDLAASRSDHPAMGGRGRAYVLERFDRRRLAGSLAAVFDSVPQRLTPVEGPSRRRRL